MTVAEPKPPRTKHPGLRREAAAGRRWPDSSGRARPVDRVRSRFAGNEVLDIRLIEYARAEASALRARTPDGTGVPGVGTTTERRRGILVTGG